MIDIIVDITIDIAYSLLYRLTSCKIRVIIKILKENYYWSPVCLAILYVCFLFFGSKQCLALIFIIDTGFWIYENDV